MRVKGSRVPNCAAALYSCEAGPPDTKRPCPAECFRAMLPWPQGRTMPDPSDFISKKATTPTPRHPAKRWRRRLIIALGLLGAGGILVLFIGPSLARPYLRRRLQAMVSSQLNAELRIESIAYRFPYGIHGEKAALVASGPDGMAF